MPSDGRTTLLVPGGLQEVLHRVIPPYQVHTTDGDPSHRTMISLCMIVRDEAPTVEAALRSALPVVDEAIVLDTGSTDGTPDILRRLSEEFPAGAFPAIPITVRPHEWKDDFSEARNAAADLATHEWVVVLDGDERLVDARDFPLPERLAALDADAVNFIVEGVHRDAPVERIVTPRLYRRDKCRWKYPVHNQLFGWRRLASCKALIRADYTREKPARVDREKILLAYHQDHPFDVHAPFFLARMAASRDDWIAAEEWAAKATLLAPQSEEYAKAWDLLSLARLREWGARGAAMAAIRGLRYHPKREGAWLALLGAAVAGLAEHRPGSAALAVSARALALPFDVVSPSVDAAIGEAAALRPTGWTSDEVRGCLSAAAVLLRLGGSAEEIAARVREEQEAAMAAARAAGVLPPGCLPCGCMMEGTKTVHVEPTCSVFHGRPG